MRSFHLSRGNILRITAARLFLRRFASRDMLRAKQATNNNLCVVSTGVDETSFWVLGLVQIDQARQKLQYELRFILVRPVRRAFLWTKNVGFCTSSTPKLSDSEPETGQ
jgi:hypothetical protein